MAVVGAGVTGLATAYLLARSRAAMRIEVFEAEARVGGKARTTVRDGYTVDWGPNGFLAGVADTVELVRDMGLAGELQPASPAARRRYLYRDGGLRPLPCTPQGFLVSEVVPPAGRLRAALEPALARRLADTPREHEESVHAFLVRHFGATFAAALADVFVAGITAGDARELSLDALFPRLRAMEQAHGSLVRALLAQQRAARRRAAANAGGSAAGEARPPAPRLTSFRRGGMQRLLDALAEALPAPVRLATPVAALEHDATDPHPYTLRLASGRREAFDEVVIATPAPAAADLLRPLAPAAADALAGIPYAGVRVFGLGFDRIDVPRALDGFGFLVPRGQGVRSLGVLWTSTLYPAHAPAGKVLLRVLAGGRRDPEMLELPHDAALAAVRRDLRLSMGVTAEPEFLESVTWAQAIPQYILGHARRLRAIEEGLSGLPGVHLAGNAYRGVGVNDSVREARRVAQTLTGEPAA